MNVLMLGLTVLGLALIYMGSAVLLQEQARRRLELLRKQGPLPPEQAERVRREWARQYRRPEAVEFRVKQARDRAEKPWREEMWQLQTAAHPDTLAEKQAIACLIGIPGALVALVALLSILGG